MAEVLRGYKENRLECPYCLGAHTDVRTGGVDGRGEAECHDCKKMFYYHERTFVKTVKKGNSERVFIDVAPKEEDMLVDYDEEDEEEDDGVVRETVFAWKCSSCGASNEDMRALECGRCGGWNPMNPEASARHLNKRKQSR